MGWLDMAIDLAKQFEGCSLKAYPDPVYGWRRATIGYGATGPSICMNTAWTQAQADTDLEYRMTGIGAHIDSVVTVSISDEQKAALCDLAYNIGPDAFDRSTLLAMLNAEHDQGAADQFLVWNKADGRVLPGLVKRRAAERALFTLGDDFTKEPQSEPEETS